MNFESPPPKSDSLSNGLDTSYYNVKTNYSPPSATMAKRHVWRERLRLGQSCPLCRLPGPVLRQCHASIEEWGAVRPARGGGMAGEAGPHRTNLTRKS
jgi:hypothetical protein